jgi:hypothetical protein
VKTLRLFEVNPTKSLTMEQQLSLAVRNREQNRVILRILLLTLLGLYYIQEEFYIPRKIRTMYTDANRGAILTEEYISTGHSTRIYNITRMKRDAFLDLLDWLLINTNLRSSRGGVSAAEKLLIFLFITSFYKAAEERCIT